jgi:hypothetical protein
LPHVIASFVETPKTSRKNFQFVGKDFRQPATTTLVTLKQGGDSHQNGETYSEPAQIEKAHGLPRRELEVTHDTISDGLERSLVAELDPGRSSTAD